MKKGDSVEMECPECNEKHPVSLYDYSVKCDDCGHWIKESEWDAIKENAE